MLTFGALVISGELSYKLPAAGQLECRRLQLTEHLEIVRQPLETRT